MKILKLLLVFLLIICLLLSCVACAPTEEHEEPFVYKYVVVLGADGAGAFFKDTITPNVDEIFADYAYTYEMLAPLPTISAQCWGSMLHGVDPDSHGLTNEIIAEREYDVGSPYPSIFKVLRQAMPNANLASFCSWNPINYGIIENGLDVHKETVSSSDDLLLTQNIISYLDNDVPTLLFVEFDAADNAGHGYGYSGQEHLQAITAIDGYIKAIFNKYRDLGVLDETLFIVTADHGGVGHSHGGDSDAEEHVFLGIRGKTVKKTEIEFCQTKDIPCLIADALQVAPHENWTGKVPDGIFNVAD